MDSKPEASRQLNYIKHFYDIKIGDILLFRASQDFYKSQRLIMFFQALLCWQRGGHFDTTHAAICVGHDEKHNPIIVHVTEETKSSQSYQKETLQEMLNKEGGERNFLIFRPKNHEAGKVVAEIAADEKKNKDVKWKLSTAIYTYLRPAKRTSNPAIEMSTISKTNICSAFIVEAVHQAEQYRFNRGETVINSLNITPCTPKGLEQYLYNDKDNYEVGCYPGKKVYSTIKNEIKQQLVRIHLRNDHFSKCKYNLAIKQFNLITQLLKEKSGINPLEKTLSLLKTMLPVLNINTGWGFRTTSYNAVLEAARKLGIFKRDVDNFSLKKIKNLPEAIPLKGIRS